METSSPPIFMSARGAFSSSYYAIRCITTIITRTIGTAGTIGTVGTIFLFLRRVSRCFPTAAESFIQGNEICRHRRPALSEFVLRQIKRALSVEDVEKIIEPSNIQLVG